MIKLKYILLEQNLPKFDIKQLPYADDIYKFIFGKPRPTWKSIKINKHGTVTTNAITKVTQGGANVGDVFNKQINWLNINKSALYGKIPSNVLQAGDIDVQIALIKEIHKLINLGKIEDASKILECCIQKVSYFKNMYISLDNLIKSKSNTIKKINKGIVIENATAKLMISNKEISNIGSAPPSNNKTPDIWFTYKGNPYAFELKANWSARMAKFKKKEHFSSFSFNRTLGKFEGTPLTDRGKWMLKKLNESSAAKNNMKNFFNEITLPSDITTVNLFKSLSGGPNDKIIQNIAIANKQILSPSKSGGVYWIDNEYIRKRIASRTAENGANESYIVIGDIGNQQIWHLEEDVLNLGTNLFEPPNIMLEAKFHSPSAKKSGKYYYGFLLDFKAQYIKKGDMPVAGGIPFNPATFLNK